MSTLKLTATYVARAMRTARNWSVEPRVWDERTLEWRPLTRWEAVRGARFLRRNPEWLTAWD